MRETFRVDRRGEFIKVLLLAICLFYNVLSHAVLGDTALLYLVIKAGEIAINTKGSRHHSSSIDGSR